MFAELDGLLGYQLRRAQGAMHRDFMAAVADFGLTQKQAAALWLIQANAGVSQAEVAAALGMDRATMMAVTDRLEDRGFVIRKRSLDRPAPSGPVPDARPGKARCESARRGSPSTKRNSARCSRRPNSRRCSKRSRNSKRPGLNPMSSQCVRVERDGELALVVAHNPPVNTITAEVRAGLAGSSRPDPRRGRHPRGRV